MSAVDDYYIDLEPGKKCIAIRSRHILIWKGIYILTSHGALCTTYQKD